MLRPSIFGESFLNDWNDWDNWMNFSFPDVEKKLYGKHANIFYYNKYPHALQFPATFSTQIHYFSTHFLSRKS